MIRNKQYFGKRQVLIYWRISLIIYQFKNINLFLTHNNALTFLILFLYIKDLHHKSLKNLNKDAESCDKIQGKWFEEKLGPHVLVFH